MDAGTGTRLPVKPESRFAGVRVLVCVAALIFGYVSATSARGTCNESYPKAASLPGSHSAAGARPEIASQKKAKQTEPFEVRKLTQSLDLQSAGPVSPDGKYILLIGKKPDGAPNLYAMDLAQFRVHPPLTKMKWGVSGPCWSPKGDKIAFAGSDETADFPELYVLNMGNSELTRLTNNRFSDNQPVFTPDGQRIIYSSDESPLPDAAFGILHVASIPAAGGKPEYFTSDETSSRQPEISTDGKSVYLVKIDEESGRHSLWEYTFTGEPVRNITGRTFARIHGYVADPAIGALVIWGQETVDQQDDLYLVDVKTGESKRFPDPDLPKRSPAISPNGKLIAFVGAAEHETQIFLYDVGTQQIRQMTFLGNRGFSPVFISDTAVVFGSDRDQANEAYLLDLATPAAGDKKKDKK